MSTPVHREATPPKVTLDIKHINKTSNITIFSTSAPFYAHFFQENLCMLLSEKILRYWSTKNGHMLQRSKQANWDTAVSNDSCPTNSMKTVQRTRKTIAQIFSAFRKTEDTRMSYDYTCSFVPQMCHSCIADFFAHSMQKNSRHNCTYVQPFNRHKLFSYKSTAN